MEVDIAVSFLSYEWRLATSGPQPVVAGSLSGPLRLIKGSSQVDSAVGRGLIKRVGRPQAGNYSLP